MLAKAISRASILDPYKPCLNQRRRDGIDNAAAPHAELRARGFTGEAQAVRRYLRQFQPADGRTEVECLAIDLDLHLVGEQELITSTASLDVAR
ncbi:hypothetical protein [Nonomuraea sp. SYSU D8015]|uniref:hypothetical protein n=1 Tax=Nonomuraea sp. SYSU D8015 TaxID=2593644 RepID=UPI001661391D|nr:hypothetical protein [Nonomuraea sp. SYSU D8015]